MKVLTEILTRRFKGIIVCDGWKPYARFTNRIQRCWAHLLRESKDIVEKFEEAIPLHNALKELYEILTEALENGYSTDNELLNMKTAAIDLLCLDSIYG